MRRRITIVMSVLITAGCADLAPKPYQEPELRLVGRSKAATCVRGVVNELSTVGHPVASIRVLPGQFDVSLGAMQRMPGSASFVVSSIIADLGPLVQLLAPDTPDPSGLPVLVLLPGGVHVDDPEDRSRSSIEFGLIVFRDGVRVDHVRVHARAREDRRSGLSWSLHLLVVGLSTSRAEEIRGTHAEALRAAAQAAVVHALGRQLGIPSWRCTNFPVDQTVINRIADDFAELHDVEVVIKLQRILAAASPVMLPQTGRVDQPTLAALKALYTSYGWKLDSNPRAALLALWARSQSPDLDRLTALNDTDQLRIPGYLSLNAPPGAKLFLDGRAVDSGRLSLLPGHYKVSAVRNGVTSGPTSVFIKPGYEITLSFAIHQFGGVNVPESPRHPAPPKSRKSSGAST